LRLYQLLVPRFIPKKIDQRDIVLTSSPSITIINVLEISCWSDDWTVVICDEFDFGFGFGNQLFAIYVIVLVQSNMFAGFANIGILELK